MWQESLGADPNVLGRLLQLDQISYRIIGVMPPDFQFRLRRHQVWLPVTLDRTDRDYHFLTAVARLKVPRTAAAAEMTALARRLEQAYPKSNKGRTIQVDDLQEWLVVNHSFRTRLLLLFAAVGAVLLIACTNVASLLLARSAARVRELALRVALGATRVRLMRQMLTESVLLAVAGGAAGLALAEALISAAPKIIPASVMPNASPFELNSMVMAYTLGISVLTGVLFGLAPALSATRPEVQETLQDSSRGSTGGRGGQRFRQAMVAIEIALALVLLTSAGLMIESLRRLTTTELGFSPRNVLTLRLLLSTARYDAAAALRFHRLLVDKIAALPGVDSVAVGSNLPLSRITMTVPFDRADGPPRELGERPGAGYTSIGAGYLHTLGIPLQRGRDFTSADNEFAQPVGIVNEAFAAKHFANQNPVGQRILLNRPLLGKNSFADAVSVEIVGLARNVKLADLGAAPEPILYVPHPQNVWSATNWLTVRTRMDAAGLTAAVRREVMDLDKDQPVDQAGSLEETFSGQFAQPRFQSRLMGGFAGLALVLAVVGISSVSAYAVAQRRREIGVRMALGASPGTVVREIVARGMKLAAIGIVLGLLGAVAAGSALNSVLAGVSATDPVTLLGGAALLAGVAAVACYIPARKATRIDPAIALRQE
jgi:putative ABC transport system permease protein